MQSVDVAFRQEIEAAGLRPTEIVADGRIHRCPVEGKPGAKDGAYVLYPDDPPAGWWQNWRTGQEGAWSAQRGHKPTEAQRQQWDAAGNQLQAQRTSAWDEVARRAQAILAKAEPCAGHPYLDRKGVGPCPGLKIDRAGRLLTPVLGPDGKVQSLQSINADGGKRFMSGGKMSGGFFAIRGDAGPLLICEGLATGLSLHEATGDTVLVAFSAGNLEAVAAMAMSSYPRREIIICGDDDRQTKGNPGKIKAETAARTVNGKLALPVFAQPDGGGDFNDLHQAQGLETVRRQVEAAQRPQSSPEARATVEEEEWNPSIRPWPTLPSAALPGLAGDFVGLACQDSEADPAAVLVTFLVRFGIEAGPGPHVFVGEAKHAPRLFAVVVGDSSKARKGTSAQPVKRLFAWPAETMAIHRPAQRSPGPLSTGEGLVWRVRDEVAEWKIDKPGNGGWVVIDPGVEDKRLFVQDEELAAALQCTRRDGNTLSTTLRALWDSGDLEPLTKTNRTKTTGAHVGVVCHITMPELARLLGETEAFNGFANRFLWVCARRQKLVPFPQPMPDAEVARLQDRLLTALTRCQEPRQVGLAESARDLWAESYPALTKAHPGLAGCVINRAEAQVLRLSLIYALLDGADWIEAGHLRAALALWSYCQESALFIFGGRAADPVAEKVLAALESGPLTATDLHRALNNHASKGRLQAALSDLLTSGRVVESREPGRTKTRSIYTRANRELCELSPLPDRAQKDNSQTSLNSQPNSEPWTGPAEVEL